MSTTINVSGQVSYPNLFKPRNNQLSGKDEYSCDVLFDKKTDIKHINEAIDSALVKKFGADKSKHPKNLRMPIKDGDEKGTPEYEGKFYITCKTDASKAKVVLCDKMLRPLESESDLQGGDIVNAKINFYAYNAGGNKGVSIGLFGVQLLEKSDAPFSGVPRTAEGMFESYADDSYDQQNSAMFQ